MSSIVERNKIVSLIRWILVIPLAVVSSIVGPIIIAYLNSWAAPVWWENSVGELIKSAVGGAAFIYIGTITAPMYRNVISFILVILHTIFFAWVLLEVYLGLWPTVNIAFQIIIALCTYYTLKTNPHILR